jgi:uncharacterized protein YxjI
VPGPRRPGVAGPVRQELTIDQGGQTVATVSKRWFSMRDIYAVDIAPGQDNVAIMAAALALDLAED